MIRLSKRRFYTAGNFGHDATKSHRKVNGQRGSYWPAVDSERLGWVLSGSDPSFAAQRR